MAEQEQFLQVLDRDEAERRFRAALDLKPRGMEHVALDAALGRVLAADVVSPVDVPSFDRSNVDGFAVVAEDTFGASEEVPRRCGSATEDIHTGIVPATDIRSGKALIIATGGMMPRGADAVVMMEHTEVAPRQAANRARGDRRQRVCRLPAPTSPREKPCFAPGQLLTSRDTGVLAAIGVADVDVWRKPIVAILSTGDEIIAPGEPMGPAQGLRFQRPGARRRGAGTGWRAAQARHPSGRRTTPCGRRLRHALSSSPTSCCFQAERARAKETFPIALSPSSTIPALSPTAWR